MQKYTFNPVLEEDIRFWFLLFGSAFEERTCWNYIGCWHCTTEFERLKQKLELLEEDF